FAYLLLLLTLMHGLSHGTQDLYPDFLKSARSISPAVVAYMAMFYNVGAILGAVCFGHLSEKMGRRKSIIAALVLSLCSIPAWAFGGSLTVLVTGSFLLHVGLQGASGIVPAHLYALSLAGVS